MTKSGSPKGEYFGNDSPIISDHGRLLLSAINFLPEAILILDKEFYLEFCNDNVCEWTGFSREELSFRPLHQVLLPIDKWLDAEEQFTTVTKNGELNYKWKLRCKDHSLLGVTISQHKFSSEENENVYLLLLLAKETEPTKSASNFLSLAKLNEESPNPVLRVNRMGELQYFNAAAGNLLASITEPNRRKLNEAWRVRLDHAKNAPHTFELKTKDHSFSLAVSRLIDNAYQNIYGTEIPEQVASTISGESKANVPDENPEEANVQLIVQAPLTIEPEKKQVEKKPVQEAIAPKPVEIKKAAVQDKPLILVIDDDPVSRILAVHVLQDKQFRVLEADSGASALQILDKEPVDAILMDVVMPDIDGLEITRRLRRHPVARIRALPIIGISAHAYAESTRNAMEAGMDDYVTKPFNGQDLFDRIQKLLPARKQKPTKYMSTSEGKALYNLEFIKSYYENDRPFIHNIILLYSRETPVELEDIRTAIQNRQWVKVKNESHKIRTNLMMLGIQDTSKYLEKVAAWNLQEISPSDVEESFETFYKEVSEALVQLKGDIATKGESI